MTLKRTRIGWENEHLATFILSRLAFVARPITIGDDQGTDLFCTLFEREKNKKEVEVLVPRNSIAVQLKSSSAPVDVTAKLAYLGRLEIPYYVGVVDQGALALKLFSGRYLPNMLSYRGNSTLHLVLVEKLGDEYRTGNDTDGYRLECPLVAVLNADESQEDLLKKSQLILEDSFLALKGVVSRLNREYIFDAPGGRIEVFAGRDSAEVFQVNFFKRLAEALRNLRWLLKSGVQVSSEVIDAYVSVCDQFTAVGLLPDYVNQFKKELADLRSANN